MPHLPMGMHGPLLLMSHNMLLCSLPAAQRPYAPPLNHTWLFMVIPRDGLMCNLELSAHVLSGNLSVGHTALNLSVSQFRLSLESSPY